MRAVLERDFLAEASRPRAVVLRTVVAAVVATTVLLLLNFASNLGSYDPDRVGLNLFRSGAIALLLLLAILTPPLVVGSILAERQQETLPLVLASPVGGRAFALAKLVSRWFLALTVAAAALPPLAFTVLFGGVAGSQVLGLAVTAVAVALEMSAWALWISSVSKRLATAAVLSFVLPPARWAVTGFVLAWIEHQYSGGVPTAGQQLAFAFLADTTPLGAVMEVMDPGEFAREFDFANTTPGPVTALLAAQPAFAYLASAVASAVVAVLAAGERLGREAEPRESLLARSSRGRRWFRGLPGDGNPVSWKERRLLNTASSRPMYYGVLAVMALATLLAGELLVSPRSAFALLAGETTLLALVAAVQGAASLGHERDQGGWDLLRASLLTPEEILRGKLAGLALGLAFLAAIPICQLGISLALHGMDPPAALAAVALLAVHPLAWALLGFRVGLAAARVRTAVLRSVALFAAALVGLPCAGLLLVAIHHQAEDAAAWIVSGTPPLSMYFVLDCVQRGDFDFSVISPFNTWPFGLGWTLFWALLSAALLLTLPGAVARRLREDRAGG